MTRVRPVQARLERVQILGGGVMEGDFRFDLDVKRLIEQLDELQGRWEELLLLQRLPASVRAARNMKWEL